MKKSKTILIIYLFVLIPTIIILLLSGFLDTIWKLDYGKFDYNSSIISATEYLNKNEEELLKIANELYDNKSSKKYPYKGIIYSAYESNPEISNWNEKNYIKFDLDAQGALGGQYYGLIYSTESNFFDNQKLIIYDELKETNKGNNIFIRKKIKENWYFYYNDWDGKVNTSKIK